MDQSLVSVIVSCFNSEKYIAQTLSSLTDQTYRNIEIIVVDDGSTDRSRQIIESVKDGRIKYYFQENRGQSAALNYGFSKAKGAFIKFYDSDDLLHPQTIMGQVETLQDGSDENISFVEWRRFYNDVVPEDIDKSNPHTIHQDCSPIDYITFTGTPPMYQCGLWLLPKGLLSKSGLWDERLSLINDTEFFSRLLTKVKELKFSDKGYTLYRSHINNKSLSSDFSSKGIRSAILSTDLTAKWYLLIENSERIRRVICNSYILVLDWAYPRHVLYSKVLIKRMNSFPKSYRGHQKSGKLYNLIFEIFGWKVAKQLSYWFYKWKYNKS